MTKEDYISREEVREFVNFVQSIKDNHNEQGKPINYGTICDIVIRAHKLLDSPSVTPKQESKIKVLDIDEVARKLGTVDVYTVSSWVTLLDDLEYLGLKICEVEE